MMHFDKLCRAAEALSVKGIGYVARKVAESRLFLMPIVAHLDLPKAHTLEQVQFLRDMFSLPFPVTAMEDKTSVVVVSGGGVGINNRWEFIEFLDMGIDRALLMPSDAGIPASKGYVLTVGGIDEITMDETTTHYHGTLSFAAAFDEHMNLVNVLPEGLLENHDLIRGCTKNYMTALEELMLLNSPDRFIVESSPIKQRRNNKKLLRSQDRPTYVLMHPHEIRSRYGLPTGVHVSGHERRAHTRYLTSERYKSKRFTHVFIPATWVGPSEGVKSKHIWKVLLDK